MLYSDITTVLVFSSWGELAHPCHISRLPERIVQLLACLFRPLLLFQAYVGLVSVSTACALRILEENTGQILLESGQLRPSLDHFYAVGAGTGGLKVACCC